MIFKASRNWGFFIALCLNSPIHKNPLDILAVINHLSLNLKPMKKLLFLLFIPIIFACQPKTEIDRLASIAENVTIMRDDFGVPHIYGKTDAEAVFGLLYAQCEDDFA